MKLLVIVFLLSATHAALAERSTRSTDCGNPELLTNNNGVLQSHAGQDAGHNYGKNFNCLWRIQAPAGMNVELVATSFDVEDHYACVYDYVELYDGNDTTADSLGKFCGSTFLPISSTQRYLTIKFVTDTGLQLTGFRMTYNFTEEVIHSCAHGQYKCDNNQCIDERYRCDGDDDCADDSDEQDCPSPAPHTCPLMYFKCVNTSQCVNVNWVCDGDVDCLDGSDELLSLCGNRPQTSTAVTGAMIPADCGQTDIAAESGTIISPNYPGDYPGSARCVYFIQAPAGTQSIIFKFDEEFSLESGAACQYDYVSIRGEATSSTLGTYCGQVSPGEVTLTGDHAYVVFRSDAGLQYTGFRLDWRVDNTLILLK